MTHCDCSARSARDEMRHITESSEPDDIIGSDKDQNRRCRKKDKGHIDFLCELYEAQVARGRYFVHELTSEVNSRIQSVKKIMATPGTRTTVADLCMFGFAACDEGGPGFVKASVRTVTNARRVAVRLRSKCTSTHRHAQINENNAIEKGEQTRTSSRWRNGGKFERGPGRAGDARTEEDNRRCKEDRVACRMHGRAGIHTLLRVSRLRFLKHVPAIAPTPRMPTH